MANILHTYPLVAESGPSADPSVQSAKISALTKTKLETSLSQDQSWQANYLWDHRVGSFIKSHLLGTARLQFIGILTWQSLSATVTDLRVHDNQGPHLMKTHVETWNRLWSSMWGSCTLLTILHRLYSCSHVFSIVQLYCIVIIDNVNQYYIYIGWHVHPQAPDKLPSWNIGSGIETTRLGAKSEWTHQCCFSKSMLKTAPHTRHTTTVKCFFVVACPGTFIVCGDFLRNESYWYRDLLSSPASKCEQTP